MMSAAFLVSSLDRELEFGKGDLGVRLLLIFEQIHGYWRVASFL